jgi:hypothetical protein
VSEVVMKPANRSIGQRLRTTSRSVISRHHAQATPRAAHLSRRGPQQRRPADLLEMRESSRPRSITGGVASHLDAHVAAALDANGGIQSMHDRRRHTVGAMRRAPAPNDFDGWVSQLGYAPCRRRARIHLLMSGSPALPALRRGLRHPKAIVRRQCVQIFDQLVDEESLPELISALDDDDPGVRSRALHALACDRCKQNDCRPGEAVWVPRAVELLRHPDPDQRAAAIDALGKVAARRPDVATVLLAAAETEKDKGLRGKARHAATLRR